MKHLNLIKWVCIILFTQLSNNLAFSQMKPYCSFDQDLKRMESNKNSNLQIRNELDQLYAEHIRTNPSSSRANEYTLPVVFHIIHNGGNENINDNQIFQALDWLNDSFDNSSPYGPNEGADTGIRFCLATQDPDGNIVNGINRVVSPLTIFDKDVSDLQLKNLIRWNPSEYINIWIVKEIKSTFDGNGVVGYAYFPNSHGSNIDGIVIEYSTIGFSSSSNIVLSHEMGHYLGLYHTFEGACLNNDCLTQGDRVCDTPPDQTSTWVPCHLTTNSCSTDTDSGLTSNENDMNYNFMDYNTIDCVSQFTNGQAERMEFFILDKRSSLLAARSCDEPCTSPIDINITLSNESPELNENVTILNNTINATQYSWYLNGQLESTLEEPSFVFPIAGIYELIVYAVGVEDNCYAFDTIYISASCTAIAEFTPQIPDCIDIGDKIEFMYAGPANTQVKWYLNDVLASTDQKFTPEFTPGPNFIKLIAANAYCENSYTQIIFVSCNEICDNGYDDDGDGLIDCFDTDCCGECDDHYYDVCFSDNFCLENPPVTAKVKWEGAHDILTSHQPVVGDIDNDGEIEIICNRYNRRYIRYSGDGTKFQIFGSSEIAGWRTSPTLGDIDGDGFAEIFAINSDNAVICLEHDGSVKYRSVPNIAKPCCITYLGAHIQLADLNYDGILEIVFGNKILNAQNGDLLVDGELIGASEGFFYGSNGSNSTYVTIANILPDDDPNYPPGLEIITSNQILSVDLNTNTMKIEVSFPGNTDNPGIAIDYDHDGDLDVYTFKDNTLMIWEGQNANLLNSITLQAAISTTPTICNLDDDPALESVIGVRYDTHSPGYLIALDNDLSIIWTKQLDVFSFSAPISFDFNYDKKCEIVQRTDDAIYIINGETGDILFEDVCGSGTLDEHPIIADIDGDGHAELIVACNLNDPSQQYRGRLRVYEGVNDEWALTRPVWNQFSLYNTQVTDDLEIPSIQQEFHHPQLGNGVHSFNSAISYREEDHYYNLTIEDFELEQICEAPFGAKLSFTIRNNGYKLIEYTATETVYSGTPSGIVSTILHQSTGLNTLIIGPYDTIQRTINLTVDEFDPFRSHEICLVINDKGTINPPYNFPFEFPDHAFNECNFEDNMACVNYEANLFDGSVLADEILLCINESVLLEPTGDWAYYHWNDLSTGSSLLATVDGLYWVELISEDCVAFKDSIQVIIFDGDIVALDLPDTLDQCNDNVVVIEAQKGFKEYEWQDGFYESSYTAWNPGWYYLTVTDSCSNVYIDSTFIEQKEIFLDLPDTIVLCAGMDTLIKFIGFKEINVTPASINPCNNCNAAEFNSTLTSQWYYFVGYTNEDCIVLDSMYVDTRDDSTVNDTIYFCRGESVWFDGTWINEETIISTQDLICGTTQTTTFLPYFFEMETLIDSTCMDESQGSIGVFPNGTFPILYDWGDGFGSFNALSQLNENLYNLSIKDGNDCIYNYVFEIPSYDPSTFSIDPKYSTFVDTPIILNVINTSDIQSIIWSPSDDLSCDNCPNPTATLQSNQIYEITIFDNNGCNYTLYTEVLIEELTIEEEEIKIVLPNIFSPDGDGINDNFDIETVIPLNYSLSIYDRWGGLIYRVENVFTNDPYYYWDGKFRGQGISPGVYVFDLKIDIQEETIQKTGTITIVR